MALGECVPERKFLVASREVVTLSETAAFVVLRGPSQLERQKTCAARCAALPCARAVLAASLHCWSQAAAPCTTQPTMATPVPPDMSGMLSDLQQRSDRPSGTRSCNDLATPTHQISRRHQIGARSHESERQTSRRGHGGSPQPRIASQAWTVYQDLRQDVDAVAKAKDFEDAPPRKRKRVAACCGVSGLTLAGRQ